jgi:hypothetical protein
MTYGCGFSLGGTKITNFEIGKMDFQTEIMRQKPVQQHVCAEFELGIKNFFKKDSSPHYGRNR